MSTPLGAEHLGYDDDQHPDVSGSSVGDLIGGVTRDISTLMRQELELAKAELRQEFDQTKTQVTGEAKKAGRAAGMLAGAGYAGHMLVLFLSLALWWALSNLMDQGWAALIVAVLWAVVAAVLFSMGRKQLKQINTSIDVKPGIPQTTDTLKQVPSALKGR